MSGALTAVRLIHRPGRADAWLRFGRPVASRSRGRHGIAWFAPGALFGYVDWRAGEFGTVSWRLSVLVAAVPGTCVTTLPGIVPGAELLIGAAGKAAVHRLFAVIDAIEAAGIDPADVDPAHWRSRGNGLALTGAIRPFDLAAHAAAAARRALLA